MIFDDSGTPIQLQPLKPVKLGFFARYRMTIEIVFGVLILLGLLSLIGWLISLIYLFFSFSISTFV